MRDKQRCLKKAHHHFAEDEALQPWQGSFEEIRNCPFWFHPIAFSSRSLVFGNQRRVGALAAGTKMVGTHVSYGTWLDLCFRAFARRRMRTAPPAMRYPLCSTKVFSSGTLLRVSRRTRTDEQKPPSVPRQGHRQALPQCSWITKDDSPFLPLQNFGS